MGSKGDDLPKNMTVQEYSRSLFTQLLKDCERGGAAFDGELFRVVVEQHGEKLYGLCLKLARRAQGDAKVPMRVLRDEIARTEFTSEMTARAKQVETLFKLYDEVEWRAAAGLARGSEQEAAAVVFEELRARFVRLVVGETWEDSPRLRLVALKRMHKYKAAERRLGRQGSSVARGAVGGGGLKAQLSRKLSGSISVGTWEDAFEELSKAPSARLVPLLKLMLMEAGPEPAALADKGGEGEGEAASGGGIKAKRAPSDAEEVVGRLTMTDLLSMDEPPPGATPPAPPAVNGTNGVHSANGTRPAHAGGSPFGDGGYSGGGGGGSYSGSGAASFAGAAAPPDPWQLPPAGPAAGGFDAFGNGGRSAFVNGLADIHLPPAGSAPAALSPQASMASLRSGASGSTPRAGDAPSPPAPGTSPYLGVRQPFKDNTFSDLSPIGSLNTR